MTASEIKEVKDLIEIVTAVQRKVQLLYIDIEEKYDNLSEKSQEGRKGDKLQSEMESLGEVETALDEALSALEDSKLH